MADEPLRVAEVPATQDGRDGDFAHLNKQLRCCRRCRLIKTDRQFRDNGCDNCTQYEPGDYSGEGIFNLTTNNFQGMITIMEPGSSWAAQWLHLGKLLPGCYAMNLPEEERMDVEVGRRRR